MVRSCLVCCTIAKISFLRLVVLQVAFMSSACLYRHFHTQCTTHLASGFFPLSAFSWNSSTMCNETSDTDRFISVQRAINGGRDSNRLELSPYGIEANRTKRLHDISRTSENLGSSKRKFMLSLTRRCPKSRSITPHRRC